MKRFLIYMISKFTEWEVAARSGTTAKTWRADILIPRIDLANKEYLLYG